MMRLRALHAQHVRVTDACREGAIAGSDFLSRGADLNGRIGEEQTSSGDLRHVEVKLRDL